MMSQSRLLRLLEDDKAKIEEEIKHQEQTRAELQHALDKQHERLAHSKAELAAAEAAIAREKGVSVEPLSHSEQEILPPALGRTSTNTPFSTTDPAPLLETNHPAEPELPSQQGEVPGNAISAPHLLEEIIPKPAPALMPRAGPALGIIGQASATSGRGEKLLCERYKCIQEIDGKWTMVWCPICGLNVTNDGSFLSGNWGIKLHMGRAHRSMLASPEVPFAPEDVMILGGFRVLTSEKVSGIYDGNLGVERVHEEKKLEKRKAREKKIAEKRAKGKKDKKAQSQAVQAAVNDQPTQPDGNADLDAIQSSGLPIMANNGTATGVLDETSAVLRTYGGFAQLSPETRVPWPQLPPVVQTTANPAPTGGLPTPDAQARNKRPVYHVISDSEDEGDRKPAFRSKSLRAEENDRESTHFELDENYP